MICDQAMHHGGVEPAQKSSSAFGPKRLKQAKRKGEGEEQGKKKIPTPTHIVTVVSPLPLPVLGLDSFPPACPKRSVIVFPLLTTLHLQSSFRFTLSPPSIYYVQVQSAGSHVAQISGHL
jgi:hypothetical protein